jgi:DNA-binding GntR family transcriptional regulator
MTAKRRLRSRTLADEAYLAVREDILRGQLRPGMPVSRRRLARELGMSVVPVTDALKRLEEDGLLETRARAGTRVRVPSETDVRELYELREALETQASRLFAVRATPQQCAELRRLAAEVDALFSRLATASDDPAFRFKVHSTHLRFHMRIAECAGSTLLKHMIERRHVLIMNWLFDVSARRTPLPLGFHARLAAALTSRDPGKADAAMRAHVQYGFNEISGGLRLLDPSEWRERQRHNVRPLR